MKKTNPITTMVLLTMIVLSACSGTQAAGTEAIPQGLLNADYENALPVEMQLAFGTLKLDGTENAVNVEAAGELLPLWKAVRSLSESDSAASEEIQALFKQIQETMTPGQVQAIAAMQLTGEDMAQVAVELGLEFLGGGRLGNLDPEMQATVQAARESGQFPQGGDFPGGGFRGGDGPVIVGPEGGQGFPGGGFRGGSPDGQLSPEQQATMEARRAANGGGGARFGVPTAILNAVIEYLETKVQ